MTRTAASNRTRAAGRGRALGRARPGAALDQTAPEVTGLAVQPNTDTAVTLVWQTSEGARSTVRYREQGDTDWLDGGEDIALATDHAMPLSGLMAGTGYEAYVTADDAAGNGIASGVVSWTTPGAADTTPPVVSGAATENLAATSTDIVWATDEAADSQVVYSTTPFPWDGGTATTSVPSSPADTAIRVVSHRVSLAGLDPETTYYVWPKSTDAAGNASSGGTFSFTTPAQAGGFDAGPLALTATYDSIGVEVPFTGDADLNAVAVLEYKKSSGGAYQTALEPWRTDGKSSDTAKAFYASVLICDPGTSYDIRVTVNDPTDDTGTVLTGSVTTRAETITPAASLTVTHYVEQTGGSDGNAGTSSGAAWATLQKAWDSAPSGAVVRIGAGHYLRPTGNRATPLTLVARFPACGDDGSIINVGQHAVIDWGRYTSPGGTSWVDTTLTGPGNAGAPAGAQYHIWKWAGGALSSSACHYLAYADDLDSIPKRVAIWLQDTSFLKTPAGWTEALYTNTKYRYGFTQFGSDLYCRLDGDKDPNDYYMIAGARASGSGSALIFDAADCRVSGLDIRGMVNGVQFNQAAHRGVVDHCLFVSCEAGIFTAGTQPGTYPHDFTLEHNQFADTSFRSQDPEEHTIPWGFIKGSTFGADGTTSLGQRLGEPMEVNGIHGRGGAQRVTVRHCTFDGPFNGLSPGVQTGFDRYAGMDFDVHDCYFVNIADDSLEPEEQQINFRAWNNRHDYCITVLSTGPCYWGPLYIWRCVGWKIGPEGVGLSLDGGGPSGKFFKFSTGSVPKARVYCLNNTFWTDTPQMTGGAASAGGSGGAEQFYMRNTIVRATYYVFEAKSWNEDYNQFYTSHADRGLSYNGSNKTTIASYRTASGQGAHSEPIGDIKDPAGDPAFADTATGDLHLATSSPLADAGVVVPQIAETFNGSAPSIGAYEQ